MPLAFVFVCVMLLAMIFALYMLYRNEKVHRFRCMVIEMAFRGSECDDKIIVFRKVGYDRMLWRWWLPLKIENFYSKEDCETLRSYKP